MIKHNILSLRACLAITVALPAAAFAENPVVPVEDPYALISTDNDQVARNERLVLDYARIVLEAGHFELIDQFIADDYIQHSAEMPPGRDELVAFFEPIFPRRPIEPKLRTPVFSVVGQGDLVMVGQPIWPTTIDGRTVYRGAHFDLFRIEDGLIVEHWESIDATAPGAPPNAPADGGGPDQAEH